MKRQWKGFLNADHSTPDGGGQGRRSDARPHARRMAGGGMVAQRHLRPVSADERVLSEHPVRLRSGRGRAIPLWGGLVLVSSQSRRAEWHVVATGQRPYCTCESFQVRKTCTHYDAAAKLAAEDNAMRDNDAIFRDLEQGLDHALVSYRQVGGGSKAPYLEGWVAIDQANRIFGYDGWSTSVLDVKWQPAGDNGFYVATVQVTVHGWGITKTDVGIGIPAPRGSIADNHEMAVKGAITDGLKRALRQFGNQFGNPLYDRDGDYREEPRAQQSQQPQRQAQTPAPERHGVAPTQAGAQQQPQPQQQPSDKPLCPLHNVPTIVSMAGNLGHYLGEKDAMNRRTWCALDIAVAHELSEMMTTYHVTLADLDAVLQKHRDYKAAWSDLTLAQKASVLPRLAEWAARRRRAQVERNGVDSETGEITAAGAGAVGVV